MCACVHAQRRVLEAYPIVVDLKMYSTNPISEQHVNYYTVQVNERMYQRDERDDVIISLHALILSTYI